MSVSLLPLSAERKQQIVTLTCDLVLARGMAGHEQPAAQVAIEAMRALGYADVRVDELGNVVGTLLPQADVDSASPTTGGILFDSHLDTVEAAGQWSKDPFGGEVSDGKVWGRGTSDMKGALAASICAAAFAQQDGRLKQPVHVSASVNEEQIEGLAFADVLEAYKPELVVICESTQLKLNIGGRGRAELFITTEGIPAHASTPQLGVNALKQMARLVLELERWQPPHDPELGYGILEPTEIISHPFPSISVLPDACRIRCDRRLLVGETADEILAPINALIEHMAQRDSTFKARAEIDTETITTYTGQTRTGFKIQPAWKFSPNEEWVRRAIAALGNPTIGYYAFCTNAARSAGILGIPTLGFGPGSESTAHIADEYVELEQLWGAAAGYYPLCSL